MIPNSSTPEQGAINTVGRDIFVGLVLDLCRNTENWQVQQRHLRDAVDIAIRAALVWAMVRAEKQVEP